MIFLLSLLIAWKPITLSPILATNYYVSSIGSDQNPGTSPVSAWLTINKVNSTSFKPGDQILFEAGKTFNGKIYLDKSNDSSSSTSPIIISSYGSGRATIASSADGIFVYNLAGIKIANINFLGSASTGNGVSFYTDLSETVTGITIEDVDISFFGQNGISIGSWNGSSGYTDVLINRVSAHHNRNGILTYAQNPNSHKNIKVSNSTTFLNTGVAGISSPSGSGIVLGGVDGGVIEYCRSYENGANNTSGSGPIGIWTYDSNNITIQFNESYNNLTNAEAGGGDGGGFDLDGGVTNSVMQYNFSHGNRGAGYLLGSYSGSNQTSGNTIRYNISLNDGNYKNYGGITVYGDVARANIYNNTLYQSQNNSNPAIRFLNYLANFSDINFYNNVITTSQGAPLILADSGLSLSGVKFAGNNYYSFNSSFKILWNGNTYNSLSNWKQANQEQNSGLQSDPLFAQPGGSNATDYKQKTGSVLIDSGQNLSSFGLSTGGKDYAGISTPQGGNFDIGAFEIISSVVTPTPTVRPGDANRDGTVDGSDFIIWKNEYINRGDNTSDFNLDSRVDGLDFNIWKSAYLKK